ncbi:site-specific DNA-methyltransferase [Micavibrio aeruginosavorus]|uniref:Methyltransferase n=1 Tax=Micavibrio aeruginosavorus (strain ARL-13) TaxID=856793 RepID=G2KNQ2_MICAA|nr:DNA methyltransferase [Micavibrio aeruginosavorus]AEP10297.1 DNA methylase family protein [Micavibrio aeruginosavorus ARL-13]
MTKSTLKSLNESTHLQVSYLPISTIKPYAKNPRTHSQKQIKQIVESIRTFGFTNPLLLDDDCSLIAGHGRLEAAKILGLERVPTICLSHMSEAQRRAYIIADNKLAENAGWDKDLLALEFSYLSSLDLDFDLTITGFETPEIDLFLESSSEEKPTDDFTEDVPKKPSSKPGDIWLLGKHKIICGDATDPETYIALMGNKKADLVFTDPPYNVPVAGHVCGAGAIQHDDFVMASGEMSASQFTEFLEKTFRNLVSFSSDGSIHYVCMDWRHMEEILKAGKIFTELKNLCIWNKTNGGMGSLYRSKHELVFVFKNGKKPHVNNIMLGEHGRYRTNVWDYAGVNTFSENRMEDLADHPTVKPIQMVADAIQDCSHRNGIVLDCFGGSGTTLLAAEQTGRHACLIEMDPRYVDVTIKRYEKMTGKKAIHQITGQAFSATLKNGGRDE